MTEDEKKSSVPEMEEWQRELFHLVESSMYPLSFLLPRRSGRATLLKQLAEKYPPKPKKEDIKIIIDDPINQKAVREISGRSPGGVIVFGRWWQK